MKNGFFTDWVPRYAPGNKRYYEKDPELDGRKLAGKYKVPSATDLPNSRILVDVGAAQGYFSTKNHDKFDRIYCFEPCYPNFRKLARNIQENSEFLNKIAFFNYAAGKPEDSYNFIDFCFVPSLSPYGSSLYRDKTDKENKKAQKAHHRVPIISFEDILLLINEKKIDVLKCDTEGAEYDFLFGQDLSLVDILVLETHRNILGHKKMSDLIEFIVSQGFSEDLIPPSKKTRWAKNFRNNALERSVEEFTLYNTNNAEEIRKKWVI